MATVKRHEAGTYEIATAGARLQTLVVCQYLKISLDDSHGTWDQATQISGGSIPLDREAVKALMQACLDFLVMT